ncbi:urea amidolyase [Caballeronia sordidicola]|uniref:Urea amidolyase n=1 Tax=Caballeronia sordidicola TaxID=196367 RepID=A0A158EMS5_CABSO|nr:biotin-dependent carboxyltransferase family protein [Caballeronia sordidicola]SAL08884.1 urea amidolyase [Caballeronia sordidicola]
MLDIVKPGLETTVQELPGRIGHWEQGFPPSGPADAWSFRLANLLVGNDRDTAALEWQFVGPTVRFHRDGAIALTGADMAAKLDDAPVPMWETLNVKAGQVLTCGAARTGARGYIAVSGGIATEPVLGSRATFHMAAIGGMGNGALKKDDRVPLGEPSAQFKRFRVAESARPPIDTALRTSAASKRVAAMLGPNDAWLDPHAIDMFFESEWTVQARSNRTGLRLTGPEFTFSERAYSKRPEHGQEPSNILDHGYPVGGISVAGQTAIVLIHDAPSAGGFIIPFTVPRCDLWRLGQARPNENLRFRRVTMDEANARRRRIDALCTAEALIEPTTRA